MMLGIANLFYGLGAFSEKIFNPSNAEAYRNLVFKIGYYFSILLPFIIPILLFVVY